MTQPRIYFDNNATTRIDDRVLARMNECWKVAFANPGSAHDSCRAARTVLEDSRESIAKILDADPSELIFTSGGTESLNMAIHGFAYRRQGIIALTAGEHPAVSEAVGKAVSAGFDRLVMPVNHAGLLVDDAMTAFPWPDLRLVCVILAHNETGVIQNIQRLGALCQQHQVPLVVDAVQATGKIPISFRQLNCSALAFGAHKFHGPRGVGGLLLRKGLRIPPLLQGGHQESGRRAGTESVPLIAGMAAALELWQAESHERIRFMTELRDRLEELLQLHSAPVIIHGRSAPRLPNTLSIAFPGVTGESLLLNLHLAGIACSLGSTCASGSAEPAPALLAMGVAPEDCRSTIRISLSCQNTAKEIQDAAEVISKIVGRMRAESSIGGTEHVAGSK
ncbi:MAG: cysteine desulfurase family protein [Planctomycetota bacterium]